MDDKIDVLLVDDEPSGLLALESALESLGENLITARSGRDALKYLLDHDCAVILLDVQMPDMDGYETATLIRERERARHTPIIFLTAAHKTDAQMFRGYAVGAVDYLFKPIDADILRSKVAAFVDLAKKTSLIKNQAQALERAHTETKGLLAALEQKNRDLEVANKELEAFSQSVSHDLRTPLRNMVGFAEMLVEDYAASLDEDVRSQLQLIQNAADHMSLMLDGLLALSRVARAEMRWESVDLTQLAATIVGSFKAAAGERKIDLHIQEGLVCRGDSRLMRIALENLLGNAWKFTSKRAIARIELGFKRLDGVQTYYVADNGAGFDMAYASRLFRQFHRLHAATDFEGTGVGLATVQRVVRRHGGRIWAEAEVERGATFWFTLGESAA